MWIRFLIWASLHGVSNVRCGIRDGLAIKGFKRAGRDRRIVAGFKEWGVGVEMRTRLRAR
jgi:hypothetical protein